MKARDIVRVVLFALAEHRVGKGARLLSLYFNPRTGLEVR